MSGIYNENTGKGLECLTSVTECVWNNYRVYWNLFEMSTEYTGTCLECLPSVQELTGMYTEKMELCEICSELTGMSLEHLPSNWYCVEYVSSILECV